MEQELRGGETADGEDLFLAQATAERAEEVIRIFTAVFRLCVKKSA